MQSGNAQHREKSLAESGKLRKNSIGLAHVVFFVVAAAAPLTAVVGATPPGFAFGNGPGMAGAFVLTGLLYLIFSTGFTAMSRHVGSAGAFYAYITHGLGKPAGVGGAFIAILTYNAIQIATYAALGVFAGQALAPFGITPPWWLIAAAAVGIVMLCGRRNIGFSANLLAVCMFAEIAILALLDIVIVVHGGGPRGLSLSSLSPRTVFAPGLGVSLVFVVGSYMGFEATAIFAEEARDPERTIPRATYIALLLITGFYAFSTWAITQFYGADAVAAVARDHLSTFYFDAATALLGSWMTGLMNMLLITSLFACALSFHNTINRYLFALGREGLIWRRLGETGIHSGSPAMAGILQSIGALIVIAAFAVGGQDPYAVVFSWSAAMATIGILVVQLAVSVAVIVFFWRDARGISLWRRVIAPAIAAIGLLAAVWLVVVNLPLLAGSDSVLVLAFPYLVAGTGLFGAGLALWLRARRPVLYAALGRVFET
jgi:amino acid transporter